MAKSKIGSLPPSDPTISVQASPFSNPSAAFKYTQAATSSVSKQSKSNSHLPPQIPTYRSVIIEKHTNGTSTNLNIDSIKSSTSKVKYAPPGQPATVLNTVITT